MTVPRGVSQGWRRGTRSSPEPALQAIRIKNSLLEGIRITWGVGVVLIRIVAVSVLRVDLASQANSAEGTEIFD
jgi:hypothetical protein